MQEVISSLTNIIIWAQTPTVIIGACVLLFLGYIFMTGGEEGQRRAKKGFLYLAVGALMVLGCISIANEFANNIKF